jgi:hypothetical protein
MNMHCEHGPKEKASLGELVEVCDVALSFIQERTQLFKLLRAYSVCEDPNDIFNSTLERLQRLERVSDQIRLALRDVMSVKDGAGGIKPVLKNQGRAFIPDGAPQYARSEPERSGRSVG